MRNGLRMRSGEDPRACPGASRMKLRVVWNDAFIIVFRAIMEVEMHEAENEEWQAARRVVR